MANMHRSLDRDMVGMREEDIKQAIKELFYWQCDVGATNFHAILYMMFQKADGTNKRKLARGFPEEAEAHRRWMESSDQTEFFRSYGFITPQEEEAQQQFKKSLEEA